MPILLSLKSPRHSTAKDLRQNKLAKLSLDFLILHAGGWSLFRFQTSKTVQEMLGSNQGHTLQLQRSRGWDQSAIIVAMYSLKFEIF